MVTSTAVRARTTAEFAAAAGSWNCSIRSTGDLYLSAAATLLAEARSEAAGVERLMLVGHEPTWSQAVALFSDGGRVRMVTAALARLDFPGNDWSRIDFGMATLAWLITPKLLGDDEDRNPESSRRGTSGPRARGPPCRFPQSLGTARSVQRP